MNANHHGLNDRSIIAISAALADAYSKKNATYDLSIDHSIGRWYSYYEQVMGLLEKRSRHGVRSILDLGSDNGILTASRCALSGCKCTGY
jgi:hypothetical protein